MREGSPFGKHDTDTSEDSAEAEERQSSQQERIDTSETERRSLAELIMRQHESRKETPPPPRGFLGGLEIAKNPLEDDEDEEDEEAIPEQTPPAAISEPAESSESLPQPRGTEYQRATDTRVEVAVEDLPKDGAPLEVVSEDVPSNTFKKDFADHLEQANNNPRDIIESLPREASAEAAIEGNTAVIEIENENKPEYADQNFGKTPRTEIISKKDIGDVDEQDLPQNTVVMNTTGGPSSGRSSGGGSGGAGDGPTPVGYPGGGQNAHNTPPPPPSPPGSSPSGPGGPYYNSYGGASGGGSGFGPGNTYATAPASANVAPVISTGNLLRGHEHPHTHPGIIAALLVSHALGVRRANQLRKDAERTRDDFNKRMQAAEERLAIQDQERRRSMVLAEERQRSDTAAEQQISTSPIEQGPVAAGARPERSPSGVSEVVAVPAVERVAERAEQERIAQREQLIRNRAIAQRESERLERAKEATLGVRPVPPVEHNLGPVEAAYANPNADVGPSLENPRASFSKEGGTLPVTERKSEKWEERTLERQHEHVGSDQSSAFGAGGQGSQVGSGGGQSSLTPNPGGLFSQVEAIARANKKDMMGTSPLASRARSYSKAIAGGFAAGVVVLVMALIAYFIMG